MRLTRNDLENGGFLPMLEHRPVISPENHWLTAWLLLVDGATPSSASGSPVLGGLLELVSAIFATTLACADPAVAIGCSRVAEPRIADAIAMSRTTAARPIIPTLTRCIV
ncbi:hypothetical protein [Sphingomonas sp. GC_Shp_4]|nr:hypothetical protein [Sphingomonas sp. GC_Shp_4]